MSTQKRIEKAEKEAAWFGPFDELTDYWFELAGQAFDEDTIKLIAAGVEAQHSKRAITPQQRDAVEMFDAELDKVWPAVVDKFGQAHIDAVTDSIPEGYSGH